MIDQIRDALELRNAARDQAIRRSRMLIRHCANSIRAMHRGEYAQAHDLLQTAKAAAQEMVADVSGYADVYYAGYTQDALKEYVEACAVYALLRREPIPSLADLGVEVDYPAYLGGLAEAASELRRAILDTIRRGNLDRGETLIEDMEDVYVAMTTIDFPDAVTGGLRRKTDALRAVLERTRGDLTVTVQQERLRQALRDFEARVGRGAEG
ncbi:MAG: haloacid dehalogenase [Anaerolineae bacterium]|nr:haloacid dehalogenase [Anaerolineae bacterium]